VFSATASAACLLGLSREQIVSAFGIAGVQASGCYELVEGVNNEMRGLYAGFCQQGRDAQRADDYEGICERSGPPGANQRSNAAPDRR
jgi:hypothetical protein